MLARGAVDAGVCDLGLPMGEESVLFDKAFKGPTFDRVVLNIFDAVLDFAFGQSCQIHPIKVMRR